MRCGIRMGSLQAAREMFMRESKVKSMSSTRGRLLEIMVVLAMCLALDEQWLSSNFTSVSSVVARSDRDGIYASVLPHVTGADLSSFRQVELFSLEVNKFLRPQSINTKPPTIVPPCASNYHDIAHSNPRQNPASHNTIYARPLTFLHPSFAAPRSYKYLLPRSASFSREELRIR